MRLLFHGHPFFFCLLWIVAGVGVPVLFVVVLPPFGPIAFVSWALGSMAVMAWLEIRYGGQWRPQAARHLQPDPEPEPEPQPSRPEPPHVAPTPAVFPLLRLRTPFTRDELVAAFRRRSLELHPDHGGNAALFRMLLAERKRAMELHP